MAVKRWILVSAVAFCAGTLGASCDKSKADPPSTDTPTAGGGAYDPCGGKECGAECNLCAPDDPLCAETAEVKQCNAAGTCSSSPAAC